MASSTPLSARAPFSGALRMKQGPLMWRLAQQARLLLPVAVVAGLAAYTWWLVQAMPDASAKAAAALPAALPDYVLSQARVERMDAQGQRMTLLQGRLMSHYAQGDRLQVSALYLVAQNPNGQSPDKMLQAWANDGRYSGEHGDIELLGQARVVTTGATGSQATTFTGEQLRWQPRQQVLSTNRPVVLQSPRGTVRGARLHHDASTGLSDLSGRVTGTLLPKP